MCWSPHYATTRVRRIGGRLTDRCATGNKLIRRGCSATAHLGTLRRDRLFVPPFSIKRELDGGPQRSRAQGGIVSATLVSPSLRCRRHRESRNEASSCARRLVDVFAPAHLQHPRARGEHGGTLDPHPRARKRGSVDAPFRGGKCRGACRAAAGVSSMERTQRRRRQARPGQTVGKLSSLARQVKRSVYRRAIVPFTVGS